jgi:uncharacterized membrane protein
MPATVGFPLLGVIFAALGAPLAARRVPPNRWYGLRVAATFADERVWYDANAAAGRHTVLLGAVLVVVALVLPGVARLPAGAYSGICAAVIGLGSLGLTVRDWRLANRLLRERRETAGRERG